LTGLLGDKKMISTCPHCTKEFNFTEGQLAKIQAALSTLKGGTLKLKCPRCYQPVELLSDGSLADWRQPAPPAAKGGEAAATPSLPTPPPPPDIDWLTKGVFTDDEKIKDIAKALVLLDPGEARANVLSAMVESFHQPTAVDTVEDALMHLQQIQYSTVILHSRFAGVKLRKSPIHALLSTMPMSQRRYIYYILVGPEFNSLYTLEALSHSANLVVNERDSDHFKNLYKRGKADYDELFGPYIGVLKEMGTI
jgi:hypothetical protein